MSFTLPNEPLAPIPSGHTPRAADGIRGGDRIFFPALNAVRAYAAAGVVIWHMRQLMILFRVPIAEPFYETLSRIFPRGDDSVMLFFVLSGFLITYLLMAEHQRTGTVAVGKFYLRRILRIWPLYYLLVLLGFLILPLCVGWEHYTYLQYDEKYFPRLVLYTLLLPNVAFSIYPGGIPIGHLWSIGVEEQFYLVWPALMKWFAKRPLIAIVGIIAIKSGLYYLDSVLTAETRNFRRGEWAGTLKNTFLILRLLRLDCMAVGGLAAYIAFHAPRWGVMRWIYHPLIALLALAAMAWTIGTLYRPYTPYGGVGQAGIYAVFILCVGANPVLPRWLIVVLTPIDYLGRISYGLYMYHVPVMFCLLRGFQRHRVVWHTGFQYFPAKRGIKIIAPAVASVDRNVALLILVFAVTVAVATLSFYLFERPFLKLKRKYTVIRSGSPETTLLPEVQPSPPDYRSKIIPQSPTSPR